MRTMEQKSKDMAYIFFMAEAEGMLPTRAGKINAVINDIKNYPCPTIDFDIFCYILNRHGLSYNELTQKEINYINISIK